jgi:hypothetical protein
MEKKTIPVGYRENHRGDLVTETSIKDIDLVRDRLTMEIVEKAKAMNKTLATLKANIFGDIAAFVELSAEQYGVKWGGRKGSVMLTSFNGRYRVIRAMSDLMVFDERLQAAKALIDECLGDWSNGANQYLITIVNDVFRVDKQGELSTSKVLGLRRHNIQDARWIRAMDAIADALQVVGTCSYLRVYERVGDTDKYKQISLDMAGA